MPQVISMIAARTPIVRKVRKETNGSAISLMPSWEKALTILIEAVNQRINAISRKATFLIISRINEKPVYRLNEHKGPLKIAKSNFKMNFLLRVCPFLLLI